MVLVCRSVCFCTVLSKCCLTGKCCSRRSPGLQVGRRGMLSARWLLLSPPCLSSSTPECFFMVWPLVKWSIVHQSMRSQAARAPQEISCPQWSNSTVISSFLIQYNKSFKRAFVFKFCSSWCFRLTQLACLACMQWLLSKTEQKVAPNPPSRLFSPWNRYVQRGNTMQSPLSPLHH